MYKAPTKKANVPCRFNQHHWTKGSCSTSPSPPKPAKGCVASKTCGLFFSEAAEGSGNHKYLQIYNPTNKAINLAGYAFPSAANGAKSRGKHEYWNAFKKGARIKSRGVYTICHPNADKKIKAICDQTHKYLSNGDDAYCLVKGSKTKYTFVDCIGDFGKDPGKGYKVCGKAAATQDNTIVRKCNVRVGNQGSATSKATAGHFAGWKKSAGTTAKNCEWTIKAKDFWKSAAGHKEMINHNLC
jgi:predicted extracellular nuclease